MSKYAHEMTFKELAECGRDVTDMTGRIIRRSDDPRQRWSMWQKDVQNAAKRGLVSRDVMDYFQATKHLSRPPQEGDTTILNNTPLPKILFVEKQTQKFTWSPSKLMTYETCPFKFAAESYYKTVPYEETPATIWGTRVHKAAEDFINGMEINDLEAFEAVAPYVRLLSKLPGEKLPELKIALDENYRVTDWDNGTARMIADLVVKNGASLKVYDYKTGKMKDDTTQMQVYAYALAIIFPDVTEIECKYVWLKEKKTTGFKVTRSELLPIAKDIRDRIKRMKDAWDRENFPMRKSGLCRSWCGALECPYNGRLK